MEDKHKPFACETCFWFDDKGWARSHKDDTKDGGICQRLHKPEMPKYGGIDFCGEHQDGPPGMEKEKSQHPYAERNKRLRAILELNEAKCPLFGKVKLFTLVHECKHREDGRCKLDEKGPWCWMIRCDDPNADPKFPFYEDKPWNVMKQCPDERTDGLGCENLELDENHRNCCHWLMDGEPGPIASPPLCCFCKTGDVA